jgi:hypothetical protein
LRMSFQPLRTAQRFSSDSVGSLRVRISTS